jgi:anti-anti-sigma factor
MDAGVLHWKEDSAGEPAEGLLCEERNMVAPARYEIEHDGDILIITPLVDLRELDYQEIESGMSNVLDRVGDGTVRNVVVDFHRTDYFGSTALGFFVKLCQRLRRSHGNLAFCNLSGHEREILEVTRLDHLWPICSSRAEALAVVRKGVAP